ncbi:hypothetical protein [Paraflavitalea pollutisoli]|uniref:hypothetical protein n=1 Tax=Paraflavitalea pollutisoli TaxID=3034143 RepID=UPI0023EABFA5|nr:hypothetical protein [Paraflavitalea sp. H1-2-19X]
MSHRRILPGWLILIAAIACKDPAPTTQQQSTAGQSVKTAYPCAPLANKDTLFAIGNRILETGAQEHIWNLTELDTSHYFNVADYFVSADRKDQLVWIEGQAGGSAGTARNLLLLLRCADSLQVIGAEQVGDVSLADIKDLNGDGIKEIISQSSFSWMGECGNSYQIINYKGGVRNELLHLQGMSILDCGLDSVYSHIQEGDTLETRLDIKLLPRESARFAVQQVRTVKIHQGGANDADIKSNLLVRVDTTIIPLK